MNYLEEKVCKVVREKHLDLRERLEETKAELEEMKGTLNAGRIIQLIDYALANEWDEVRVWLEALATNKTNE